jgi:hypothetical protein
MLNLTRAARLRRLRQLEPAAPPVRYERKRAGELRHIDVERLGRFDRVGQDLHPHHGQEVKRKDT